MQFIKLITSLYDTYIYRDASNEEMTILGHFLASDARYDPSSFIEYALNDWEQYTSSNLTALEKENGYILLTDLYSEEKIPTVLKMTQEQFIQILTDWKEKVCKLKPKEVIIKYENDQFIIETKN